MWNPDHLIDMGPGGGKHGGNIIIEEHPSIIANDKNRFHGHTRHFLYKSKR